MENLIQQLSQPGMTADGEIRHPTTTQRRAAEAIRLLMQLREQDLQGRLRAEQNEQKLLAELVLYRTNVNVSSAYKDAMNEDFMRNCT